MKAHLLIIDQLTPNVKRLKQSDTRTLFKRVYRCWRYPGCQQVIAYQLEVALTEEKNVGGAAFQHCQVRSTLPYAVGPQCIPIREERAARRRHCCSTH